MSLSELIKPHSTIGILVLIERRPAIRASFLMWMRKASYNSRHWRIQPFFFLGGGGRSGVSAASGLLGKPGTYQGLLGVGI